MKKLLPFVGVLLAFVALACFEQDYLWTAQEHNLFLHTPLFFQQCMATSGGLLTWAGAYLTQFFYYPMLGAAILCLLWALFMLLLKQTFRIPNRWLWLTLIPVGMLLLSDVCLGYWLYFLKLRGHLFVGTLGFMIATLLVWAYRVLPRRSYLPTLFIVVSTIISYPLFGFYGLLATLLMGILEVRGKKKEERKRWKVIPLVISITAVVVVPLLYYHFIYYLTPIGNIYWTALPVFNHNGVSDSWQYAPYIIVVVWMIIGATTPQSLPNGKEVEIPTDRTVSKALYSPSVREGLGVGILLALILFCWNKDDNFHRELTMRRQLEQQDWTAMLSTFKDAKGEPTRALCMMKNLALQRTGRLSKDINSYADGFCRPDAPFPVHVVHTIGKMLYLQYGIPNYCYRWCMEDGVEYGWNVEGLKLMVKCSLLNNEPVAAQRYLSLLKKTDFHRQWARKYEAYLHQPRLMFEDEEFKGILPLLRDDDFLTSDQSQLEPFLIEHLVTMPGANPIQRELANIYFNFYLKRNRYIEK